MLMTKRRKRKIINFIIDGLMWILMFLFNSIVSTFEGMCYLFKYIKNYKLNKSNITLKSLERDIRSMNDRQFEYFCYLLFKELGYNAKLTSSTNDYGRDIILNNNIFVECKHYSDNNYVGREICQKLLGSIQMFNAKRGIIVTTGKFNNNAYECANMVENLDLWDMGDIFKQITSIKSDNMKKIMFKTFNYKCA